MGSLHTLAAEHNNLSSCRAITALPSLTSLDLSHNQLAEVAEVAEMVAALPRLVCLDLRGNPLCQRPKYRDRVILMAPCLGPTALLPRQ